jgi:hypothetical protein
MKLYTPKERLYASDYSVAKDLFDEKNFEKAVIGPLQEVRNLAGAGLFTAYQGEHNWERTSAHVEPVHERPNAQGWKARICAVSACVSNIY